jgi:hypothetical protein
VTVVLLPTPRVAVRQPAVRAALVLVVAGPAMVAWGGPDGQAAVRLRVVGLVLGAALAMVWDDRCAVVTAATPVGVPAVRRGCLLVVLALLCLGFGLSCLVVRPAPVPYGAVVLQTAGAAAVLLALVGWLARDRPGEQVAALPFPLLLVGLGVVSRLPAELSLMRTSPGDPGWPAERGRWLAVLLLAVAASGLLDRDRAAPALQRAHLRLVPVQLVLGHRAGGGERRRGRVLDEQRPSGLQHRQHLGVGRRDRRPLVASAQEVAGAQERQQQDRQQQPHGFDDGATTAEP